MYYNLIVVHVDILANLIVTCGRVTLLVIFLMVVIPAHLCFVFWLQGKPYFLVKWLGYASAENTWEPYENVELCEMLASFGKSNPKDKEALDDFLAKKSGGGKRKA